jgi:hypothetical protein
MPPAIAEVFDPLKAELVALHDLWALYRQVFAHSEARIQLLQRVANFFFGATQWALYHEVILALCRFTDPAESSKKPGHRPNLTLERLVDEVTKDDSTFGNQLRSNELDAVTKWRDAHFETVRSKRIAHNDLSTMQLRWGGTPGPDWPSREQIGQLLCFAADLMNAVEQNYTDGPTAYALLDDGVYAPHDRFPGHDGETLVRVLEEFAQRHDAELNAGLRTRVIAPQPRRSNRPVQHGGAESGE